MTNNGSWNYFGATILFRLLSSQITRSYLVFRQKEINDVYESLDF